VPSTFSTFHIGWRGLYASRMGMDVTAHNVANVNTEGYSRQNAKIVASRPYAVPGLNRTTTPGQIGTGVDVASINRTKDQFVRNLLQREQSIMGYWETKAHTYEQIELLFAEPSDTGLAFILDDFFGSLHDLSRDPQDTAVREVVLQKASVLADTISHVYGQLKQLYERTTELVDIKITELNSAAVEVAELNKQIAAVVRLGDNPNDLLDKRDMLIERMSKIVDLQVVPLEHELVNISIDGVNLVQRYESRRMEADIDPLTGKVRGVKWQEFGSDIAIKSGELEALLETNNVIVPQYLSGLDELARALAQSVNDLHAAGYDLDGNPGGMIFVDSRTPKAGPVIPLDLSDPDFEVARYIKLNPVLDARMVAASSLAPDINGPKMGDGSNALAMAKLADALIMQSGTGTLSSFYNGMISELGVHSGQSLFMTESEGVILDNLRNWDSSISGVSIDEEVTNLVRYQHSYAAAARVITVLDEILELITTRMGLAGR
jgi:flagellar hook-associated protein 1 FlgK